MPAPTVTAMGIRFPLLSLIIGALAACASPPSPQPTPLKVILDTDMGSDCDDVGALAMLHAYSDQGKADLLAVIYSSGAIPYGAGIIDAINRYYGHDDIPIGANHDPAVGDTLDKMQAEKLARDTVAFGNRVVHNTDVMEQTQLLRQVLARQPDTSVVYITIGHTKGLYDLLVSEPDEISDRSGAELIRQKLSRWVALGALGAANAEGHRKKDWNFFFNGTAPYTSYLVAHFPSPIYFVDAGRTVMTGESLIHTPPGNIVRTAYRDWLWQVERKTLSDQRPSWDLMAVLYAVERPGAYFELLEEGYLDFDAERGCRWVSADSLSRQYFVRQKPGFEAELSRYLNALIRQ